MPLTQGIKLMKAVSMGMTFPVAKYVVILLLLITIVCSTIAVKAFRWE